MFYIFFRSRHVKDLIIRLGEKDSDDEDICNDEDDNMDDIIMQLICDNETVQ